MKWILSEWMPFLFHGKNQEAYAAYASGKIESDDFPDHLVPIKLFVSGRWSEGIRKWLEETPAQDLDEWSIVLVDKEEEADVIIIPNYDRIGANFESIKIVTPSDVFVFIEIERLALSEFAGKITLEEHQRYFKSILEGDRSERWKNLAKEWMDGTTIESFGGDDVGVRDPYPDSRDGLLLFYRDLFECYIKERKLVSITRDILRFEKARFSEYEMLESYKDVLKNSEWNAIFATIKSEWKGLEEKKVKTKSPHKRPQIGKDFNTQTFEVALSFASEQRNYVKKVATELKRLGISVFFDEFFQLELWGKDLNEALQQIYEKKCDSCVIFISKHYAIKHYPTQEKRSVLSDSMKILQGTILPVRFDNTELPGLPSSIAYVDGNQLDPEEIAIMIFNKIRKSIQVDVDETKEKVVSSQVLVDRIEKFRTDRIQGISSGNTPISTSSGPYIVMHVIPFDAFSIGKSIDLSEIEKNKEKLSILGNNIQRFRYNLDGVLGYHYSKPGKGEYIDGYVQVYRNGCIELLRTLWDWGQKYPKTIPAIEIENWILASLESLFSIADVIEIDGPFSIGVTLIDVEDYEITLLPWIAGHIPPTAERIDRYQISTPEIIIEDTTASIESSMLPAFNSIWNSGAWPKSYTYNEDGTRKADYSWTKYDLSERFPV